MAQGRANVTSSFEGIKKLGNSLSRINWDMSISKLERTNLDINKEELFIFNSHP